MVNFFDTESYHNIMVKCEKTFSSKKEMYEEIMRNNSQIAACECEISMCATMTEPEHFFKPSHNNGCISQINEYISSRLKTIKRLTHDNAVIQLILDDLYENSINEHPEEDPDYCGPFLLDDNDSEMPSSQEQDEMSEKKSKKGTRR